MSTLYMGFIMCWIYGHSSDIYKTNTSTLSGRIDLKMFPEGVWGTTGS